VLKLPNLSDSRINMHALTVICMLIVIIILLFLTFLLDLPGAGIFWIVGIG
ncbi:uncharacterized protein METZ01_LOCUS323788, partial [marine metagenome]